MDVYKEIVDWSTKKLPDWQRDALRRLFQNGECSEDDITELTYLCRKEVGIEHEDDEELGIEAIPLESKHVPVSPQSTQAVSLTFVGKFVNVNRLSKNAALNLPTNGLTVVFGDNGTGKSGYIRVLKQICRARGGAKKVHPNAYASKVEDQSARIEFEVDGEAHEYEWSPDDEYVEELSSIGIFDADSAQVHISNENELRYQPFGLDLVSRLADVVTRVSSDIHAEHDEVRDDKDFFDDIADGTEIARFLSEITHKTTPAQIDKAVKFTKKDNAALKKLRALLLKIQNQDPTEEIRKQTKRKQTLTTLIEEMSQLKNRFPKADLQAGSKQQKSHLELENAANLAVAQFKDLDVKGIGEEPWKMLWAAARSFSETHAYPETDFPNLDGKCVLCLQELGTDAQDHFSHFEEFIQTDIQRQLRNSASAMGSKKLHYESEFVRSQGILRGLQLLEDLAPETADLCESVLKFYEARKDLLVNVWAGKKVKPEIEQPALKKSVLNAEVKRIEKLLVEFEKQRKGLVSETTIQAQIDELAARKQANLSKKRIEQELERLNLENLYRKALKISGTQLITRKSRELSEEVTDVMAEDFLAETKNLRVNEDVEVQLEVTQAKYGVTYHQVVSPSANESIPLVEILSEGEHRAIAIAAFLTEANCSPNLSGLIFDDPVNSLDHDRKEAIAKRLASEGVKRQVIVFTHDLPFIFDLRNAAKESKIVPAFRTMTVHTGSGESGLIDEGLPWHGQKTKSRINTLKDLLKSASASYEKNEIDSYDGKIHAIYAKLRQTWESVVENVLFHEVVTRFDRDVKTTQLRYVYDNVTESDFKSIENGMSKCSEFLHEAAKAKVPPRPKPSEIQDDINNLESLVDELTKRHKKRG